MEADTPSVSGNPGKSGSFIMTNESDILNAHAAAAFLGAHVQTVRRLARRGELPAFKVGKDWRFRREALLRWADEQQRGAGRCSVLIIDDEELVCQTLSRMLARFGCHPSYATSGVEGLRLVAHEAPDLILLDLQMPDMNGPQFLKELRQIHPILPVVIVTGYPDSDLMREATQYAPLMLVAKPVEPELLEHTVRTAVGAKLPSRSAG